MDKYMPYIYIYIKYTNSNLMRWNKSADDSCPLCSRKQTLSHVLNDCPVALYQHRYTWRHNKVLEVIRDYLSRYISLNVTCQTASMHLFETLSILCYDQISVYSSHEESILSNLQCPMIKIGGGLDEKN